MNQVNQPIQAALFKPRKVAVKLHYSELSAFCFYWVQFDRPCDFKVQRWKKDPQWLGIIFTVENTETADFLRGLPDKFRNLQIYDL